MVEALYDLGIVGGGQLGMMLTQAAREINLSTIVLDPSGNDCSAKKVAGAQAIKGGLRERDRLFDLAEAARYLTVEIEHLDPKTLEVAALAYARVVHPSAETIYNIQDKYRQHLILTALGIPVAPHREVSTANEIRELLDQSPRGLIAKTKRDAYDGRGNAEIRGKADIAPAIARLQNGDSTRELYVEQRIPFIKELAMMVAKGVRSSEDVKLYPLVETKHLRGQLREVVAPAQVSNMVQLRAMSIVTTIAESFFQGAGVFGVEMFLGENDQIWVNECAPRVHNSGHYTIEACTTSQFSNHVLAVTEQFLGETDMVYPYAGMVNIIGDYTGMDDVSRMEGVFVHDYQKSPRPERKLGHVTLVGEDYEDFVLRMHVVSSFLTK